MTTALTPYHTPETCSRAVLNALEGLGFDYVDQPINIFRDEQRGAAYLSVNPKMKVPALGIKGTVLTETPAILLWLDGAHGRLLPGENRLSQS